MKKIIEFLKNWFEKNGLIKIIVAFAILIACVILNKEFPRFTWLSYIGVASGIYLILTPLIFMIAGIINSIEDISRKNKK